MTTDILSGKDLYQQMITLRDSIPKVEKTWVSVNKMVKPGESYKINPSIGLTAIPFIETPDVMWVVHPEDFEKLFKGIDMHEIRPNLYEIRSFIA